MASLSLTTLAARGLSVVAVAAASIALAACSAVAPVDVDTSDGVDTDAFEIIVGDCLNDGGVGEVQTIPKIDCDEPHESEVYASTEIPDGDFPEEQVIIDQAKADCTDSFANYVGIAATESKYSIGYYFPTQESWDSGDREILCYLYDKAGPITGSLMGEAE